MVEASALTSFGFGAGLAGFVAGEHRKTFAVLSVIGTVPSLVASVLVRNWTESQLEHRILTSSPKKAAWGILGLAGGWVVRERVRAAISR